MDIRHWTLDPMAAVRITCAAITLGALVITLPGCGWGADSRRAEVHGEVTLDGEAVPRGRITFFPTEGNTGPATGGTIQDGQFHIPRADGPFVGKNQIQINAPRKSGRKVPWSLNPDKMVDEQVESVPPQYNSESTLVRDVQQGTNVLDLDLHSQ